MAYLSPQNREHSGFRHIFVYGGIVDNTVPLNVYVKSRSRRYPVETSITHTERDETAFFEYEWLSSSNTYKITVMQLDLSVDVMSVYSRPAS
ncbi:unnamed protein product [Haemonchus placei]|uniref:PTP_tm domain-containing protein n=1 Tax=Haemonchus placei TaxID=6290 RepID=A0A0N4W070_HAEPC|nr:unnamed protein product [Haemonchus placei]